MAGSVLDGIRVLDFGRYIAAPYCAALLGGLGAEVIRIESPLASDDRHVMPITPEAGALYLQVNRSKASLPIDLRHEAAPALLRRLVATADVVVANMAPAALRKAGLDYASPRAIRADIILTNINAYGHAGPERDAVGFDGTGQSMSGAVHLTGLPGQPFRAAVSYVDYGTALAAGFATLAAIHARARTGEGQEVQASLLGTALTMTNPMLIEEASGQRSRMPTGNRSPIAGPSDIFVTRDGWIMVQVIGQQMFARWAGVVQAPHLLDDPRFATDLGRGEHGAVLSEVTAAWCRDRTSAACLETLRRARIPCCPVLSPAETLRAPQCREGGFMEWDGGLPFVTPMSLGATPLAQRPAPELGEGGRGALLRSGFSEAEIDDLLRGGVVGRLAET